MSSVPLGPDGKPMTVVVGSVKDTYPTVQYGSVQIFAAVTRPVPDGTDEEIVNHTRQVIRLAEYAVGCERRLLQWAMNPELRLANPATGEQFDGREHGAPANFAGPPAGYDPASMPPHPSDAINAEPEAEPEKDAKDASPPAPAVPGMPDIAPPASKA